MQKFLLVVILAFVATPVPLSGSLLQKRSILSILDTPQVTPSLSQTLNSVRHCWPSWMFSTILGHSSTASFKKDGTDVYLEDLGYTVENYTVKTDDGYILKIFRVTGSPSSLPPAPGTIKKAVFLNHGMAGTSNQWLVQQGPNNLPQLLADNGYEVWIGNARGNSYSDTHETLNKNQLPFWNFTWHEMALYDVPKVIEKILQVSGNDKIDYIGYSMGTSQYMVALSEKPELNEKIRRGFLLAPAAFVGHATTPITASAILGLQYNGTYLTDPILGGKIDTNNAMQQYLGSNAGVLCAAAAVNCAVCSNLMFFIFGFDTQQMNYTALPSFYTNYADVIGTKCIVHYTQLVHSKKFRQFDYGTANDNMKQYGSIEPPDYNVTRITAPTIIFYGRGDNLCAPEDVETLSTKFQAGVLKEFNLVDPTNNASKFNHLDFVVAKDLYPFIHERLLEILNNDEYLS